MGDNAASTDDYNAAFFRRFWPIHPNFE